jgi:hypothetical protein
MADLDWILGDGEDLEDALEDFKAEVENPELLKARHDAIRALADMDREPGDASDYWAERARHSRAKGFPVVAQQHAQKGAR